MHGRIAERTVDVASAAVPSPGRVLDVGCGTGVALGLLAARLRAATLLLGVDPAASMVAAARSGARDGRVRIEHGAAEALPIEQGTFDLVVSVTSFDHWADQALGLRQCATALRPGGTLVLTDLFSPVLAPTTVLGRRGRARTVRTCCALLRDAGFTGWTWHRMPLLRTVVATAG